MHVKKLKLINFRNYKQKEIEFNNKWNIIIGNNGVGKTNILEAIYFLATSKSPRSFNILNMRKIGAREALVSGFFIGKTVEGLIKQKLGNNKQTVCNDIGLIPFVYFVPEDLSLIKEAATNRRKMINFLIMQLFPLYKETLKKYRRIVLERNIVLKKIREGIYNSEYLENWNKGLIEEGLKILNKRKIIIQELNTKLENIAPQIFGANYSLLLKYKYFLHTKLEIEEINKETFKEALNNIRDNEIKYGITLIGPHRDDIEFIYDKKNLRHFGSQGQQRAAILAVKIVHGKVLESYLNEKAIFLFDDVLSELDNNKKETLLKVIDDGSQVFLTSTSIDGIKKLPEDSTLFELT